MRIYCSQDSKKQWVFQLKHPRRDGVLTFAADNGLEFKYVKCNELPLALNHVYM